ncbi:MAG: acetyl-CoA carboxylase biotin carboxyl carrier protein [Nannocystaceae bacterium]|nr:acetyl-CoA carboxylase biotin carboxyl carrier protein [Nannocystaceae bacterium]
MSKKRDTDDGAPLTPGGLPDIRYVQALAEVFSTYELDEIEIESGEHRVLLRRSDNAAQPAVVVAPAAAAVVAPAAAPVVEEGEFIESPFVGTFFRRPSPDAAPFVEIGASVANGNVVCIVEAMKLFNELEVEFDCRIEECLVEDGQPVEYGAKLFRVTRR